MHALQSLTLRIRKKVLAEPDTLYALRQWVRILKSIADVLYGLGKRSSAVRVAGAALHLARGAADSRDQEIDVLRRFAKWLEAT